MRTPFLRYLLCAVVVGLVLAAIPLLASGGELPADGPVTALLLAGSTVPLAGAAWGTAFHHG